MKKLLSVVLSAVMVLSLLPMRIFTVSAETPAGTSGTVGTMGHAGTTEVTHLTEVPEGYTGIYTKADLDAVRNDLSGKYILMNDIEFTDADFAEGGAFYNGGQGWQPIGNSSRRAFTGIFDGNGFVVRNLQINITSEEFACAGLFGYNKGTIKNLGLVDGSITAKVTIASYAYAYAGGIAGLNSFGTIENCYNTGSVSAKASSYANAYVYAGGIVGYNDDSDATITNCYNTGVVTATASTFYTYAYDYVSASAYAGGIAGYNDYGTITNCYNTGRVSAKATTPSSTPSSTASPHAYAGGIAGENFGSNATITNCYNTGSVSAEATTSSSFAYAFAGGIVGENSYGTIKNCYNTCSVSAKATASSSSASAYAYAGGIAGENYGSNATITNCYYANRISKGVGNGTGMTVKCTLEEMKLQNTFVGFDFETVWQIDPNADYPYPTLRAGITSIAVTTKPNKLTYLEGDAFDPTGMVVTAYYSDGTSAIITDYSIDVSETDLGKKTVTITYGGKSASFTVDIIYTVTFQNWNGDVLSTNTYHYGDTVTVIFNGVPDRTGYVFMGWARTAAAGEPEFTAAGTKTFTIGASDVTLYAVWELEHATCVPGEWIIDQNPTCTQPGSKHIECTECGETLREEMIPATGHNYVYTQTVAPSCTEEGYDLYTCDHSGCGSTKKQTIEKLPHNYGDDNVCDGCGHTIPAVHTHSYTATVVPPTCSSFGYTEYKCSCGHSYRTDYIENTSHAWTTTVTKEKTCTTDGLKLHACENCDASFTEIIPAAHNWQDTVTQPATCTTDGQISRTCADCGAVETKVIPAGHTWDAGSQTQAPTCTEAGLLHHTCTVCGHGEDSLIDPLGHHYVKGVCTRCNAKFIDNVTNDTDHPEYGMYFEVDDVKSGYGPDLINEYGVLLDYNSDATLKKVGVYLTQDGTMWRRCIAVVGENITYATYVPYLSYDEDIKYTGLNSAWINTFRLQENSDGIWCYSDYATIGVNLEDAYGNLLLSLYDIGQAGAKTRIFDDLDEMIAWLSSPNDCITHNVVNGICTSCGMYGTCGENLVWRLDDNGTLTISGTGAMTDYEYDKESDTPEHPWKDITDSIKAIVIENGVTRIGDNAFFGFANLTAVEIPDSVTSLGRNAFRDCANLSNITLPDSVTAISYAAFAYCNSLTSINIPSSVTSISSNAFFGCDSLTRVDITDLAAWCKISFEDSAANPLRYAKNLYLKNALVTSLTIPSNIENIGSYTFYGCTSLISVTIPNSVTSIASSAFTYCYNLSSVIYCGTEDQWATISIESGNTYLTDATLQFHSIENGVCSLCGYNVPYTVTFKNWDGTVLSSKTYHYGDAVTAPADPTRPADDSYVYTFTGWDKTVAATCNGNATYTAVYGKVTRVPSAITSPTYTISNNTISKIATGTTVLDLLSNINERQYVKVYNGNTEVSGDALIGTGMLVKIMDGDTAKATYTVVVTGDTNGDGKLTVTDFVQMQAHLLQKTPLQGAAAKAADTSGDGKISVTDYVQMQAHILGKSTVQPQSV